MKKSNLTNLLNTLPEINLKEDIPYSILSPLYNRVSQKELAHSEILASFLNPYDNHDHKDLFLNQFLKDIKLEINPSISKNIKIYTERKVKATEKASLRPIDILITWEFKNNKNAIIIENKLNYAPDQTEQLNDYYLGITRENFIVKKIVYMHIDQYTKKNNTDVYEDAAGLLVNYNSNDLIKSLEKCNIKNSYSHITEYINLLKNNVQNYKYMETALKVQKDLIDKHQEFKKLVAISKIVNSKEWHIAKFNIIQCGIVEDFVNHDQLIISEVHKAKEYNSYHKSLYFKDQIYWIELWSDDDSVKLYLCCKNEDVKVKDELKLDNLLFKYESNWDNWQYYSTEGSSINYPNNLSDFQTLLKNSIETLRNLKKSK